MGRWSRRGVSFVPASSPDFDRFIIGGVAAPLAIDTTVNIVDSVTSVICAAAPIIRSRLLRIRGQNRRGAGRLYVVLSISTNGGWVGLN